MKVLVTGHKGYVGSVLISKLVEKNFEIVGCDVGFYPDEIVKGSEQVKTINKDVRDLTEKDIEGYSAIIHLAGLSNDPLGEINSGLTNDINHLATVNIAKIAKKVGVERFVFSSSCSVYGAAENIVDENSEIRPLTAYAKSKADSEIELNKLKDDSFMTINLRNPTVYGISPSQRLDLVVNNLIGSVITTGKIKLLSDGSAWRPLLHVEDMADAFIHVLEIPLSKLGKDAYNVGTNIENYTVKEIAQKIQDNIPDSVVEFSKGANADPRSYKVNFDRINSELKFKLKWNLDKGITSIFNSLKESNFQGLGFNDKKFYRIQYIKWLLENKKIDSNLRFLR